MNGPEHYHEAERLLADAGHEGAEGVIWVRPDNLAAAQVHATLALAAAHALTQPIANTDDTSGHPGQEAYEEWFDAVEVGGTAADQPRRRNRITPEHMLAVAKRYANADAKGEPPTRAVAAHFDVPHSTAAKWVGRARKQGLLPAIEGGAS